MLHEPATPSGKDRAAPYKMRLGLWMFLFYLLVYAGFVAINLIDTTIMQRIVLLGLNLATVYGFGLIILAFLEAWVYNAFCLRHEKKMEKLEKEENQ
jgi:phosphotransferase system  glucose/maltose/N-acetylglucosamine-specific IIC component